MYPSAWVLRHSGLYVRRPSKHSVSGRLDHAGTLRGDVSHLPDGQVSKAVLDISDPSIFEIEKQVRDELVVDNDGAAKKLDAAETYAPPSEVFKIDALTR